MRLTRIRTLIGSLSLGVAVLATVIGPARAFQAPNPGNPSTVEDFNAGDQPREPYQRATDVLKAMKVSRGDWVGDVGAGNGYYSMRLSDAVGPDGKVYAEDIGDFAMRMLNARVKAFDLRNVEIVKGDAENPKLPADSMAAVLIVDSYHHFSQYEPMLQQILHALKPGGRLVIADYSLPEHRSQPRADQLKIHEIDPELVRAELARCGFQVLNCEDPFVKRMPEAKYARAGAADMWLMVAVRPK